MKGLTPFEARCRDALLEAALPSPGPGRPGLGDLDLARFWERFDRSAPPTLALALRAAIWGIGVGAPLLAGHRVPFAELARGEQDRILRAAWAVPLFPLRQLLTTLKLVACLAYFHDDGVQARVRGEGHR